MLNSFAVSIFEKKFYFAMLDNERTLKNSSNAQHKKEKTFSYALPEMLNWFSVSTVKPVLSKRSRDNPKSLA